MTAEQLLQYAIPFVYQEKAELEKDRLKFGIDSPSGLKNWQKKLLEKAETRIGLMSGLIQTVQALKMDYDNNNEVLKKIEQFESGLQTKGGPDLRDVVIETVIHHHERLAERVAAIPDRITQAGLMAPLMLINRCLVDYKIKYLKANNIEYVIRDSTT